MRIYLLIHTEPKEVSRVAREIATIPGVISAEPVSGQYDVIAEVEARSLDAFARTTLHEIQSVDDVVRTITCAVSGHDRLWEEHVEPGPRGPAEPEPLPWRTGFRGRRCDEGWIAAPRRDHGGRRKRPTMNSVDAIQVQTRAPGLAMAFAAAVISGVAVFTNSYGVKAFGDPTVYTTMKNVVAAVILLGILGGVTRHRSAEGFTRPRGIKQWAGLLLVGIIGGSVPFVLFFEGLSRATSVQAAFLQKTLVVWVAILAVPFLRERVRLAHLAAIGLLVWGQAALGGIGRLSFGTGEAMILAATAFWAVEVIVAKKLLRSLSALTVGTARMGIGVVVLVAWTAATTSAATLASIGPRQWSWAIATGLILAAYVATWYTALARARAVDVTSVLVFGAFVTAMLQAAVQGVALGPQVGGLILIAMGTSAVTLLGVRRPRLGLVA